MILNQAQDTATEMGILKYSIQSNIIEKSYIYKGIDLDAKHRYFLLFME